MKMTYADQLKHPNWQRKRLEMLNDANFQCTNCGDKESMLHVHHKQYFKGRMAWEYENAELDVLCVDCHKQEHDSRKLLDELVAAAGGVAMIDAIIGISAGYLYGSMDLDSELAQRLEQRRAPFFEIGIAASAFQWDGLQWRDYVIKRSEEGNTTPVVDKFADIWKSEKEE